MLGLNPSTYTAYPTPHVLPTQQRPKIAGGVLRCFLPILITHAGAEVPGGYAPVGGRAGYWCQTGS